MARPVAPWTWARALRDYGPNAKGFLLAMHTLRTWMNREGSAYPSQKKWANGCRQNVKTVRRHLKCAVENGWLEIASAGRGGQGWRHYEYRATVPDHIALQDKDQELSDGIEERR